jgi:hypothetical protein
MEIKLQKLDQGWQAEAEVNGETYRWSCWGYSRAEARREAQKMFAKAEKRAAAERAEAETARRAIVAAARRNIRARTAEAAL